VFDADLLSKADIRIPLSRGISGYVASSGNIVNLEDAYNDPRFNREVDLSTGYRTRSMLSVPIFGPSKEIVAVANLMNKIVDGRYCCFSDSDVETFQEFAAFCGLALHKTILLEETNSQRKMLSVTMELMSYHSTAKQDDIQTFYQICPAVATSIEDLTDMNFPTHSLDTSLDRLAVATLEMFRALEYPKKFQIEEKKLVPYILTVRKNYRPVLYHNFGHAVSVSHAMFLLIMHTDITKMLDDLELFAMFIGAINHDIDHRGTNNSFQKSAQTALSVIYYY
jgi:3'5'-cyclic nucleotide phosphodiesterase/GAF domain